MKETVVIAFLAGCVVLLLCILICQQFFLRKGLCGRLDAISEKLKAILDGDTDEGVMVFTDNRALTDLAAQINRLLWDRRKIRADFRRAELSSKRMLSNISHDIKTPMTVIQGYLEIMRQTGCREEMLDKVEKKAGDVTELINRFFTLAKLEAGDMEPELKKVNSNESCREAVLDFYGLLTQKGFAVELRIPETALYVRATEDSLQRILFNLISNAVRYGADGRYLGLSLYGDEGFVYIEVADKGKGIEKEFADAVFERLYTMEDSRNREIQGNGLGLTIAKKLAVQLGGDITLKSEPFVKTVFTVRLKKWQL